MKSVLVTSLVITVVISTHFSRVGGRDLLQHLGKVKAGLVEHLTGKFIPLKKLAKSRNFQKNNKGLNTIRIHSPSTSETESRQSQGLTTTKSISISSHAFLTPNFGPIPSIHRKQKQRVEKNKKGGGAPVVGGPPKRNSNIPESTTYRKQATKYLREKNKKSKHIRKPNKKNESGIKRSKLKSLKKIETSETTPVLTAFKSHEHKQSTSHQGSRNEIDVFKGGMKNKSNDKLIIDDDDSLVPVIRDSLWREDLVGRVLTA